MFIVLDNIPDSMLNVLYHALPNTLSSKIAVAGNKSCIYYVINVRKWKGETFQLLT